MVLGELGGKITGALRQLTDASVVDKNAMEACLKDITGALLQADVELSQVVELKREVYKEVDLNNLGPGVNAAKMVQKSIFKQIVSMLETGETFSPTKGRPNVIMLVGLQGAGKTTTAAKYARWHAKKGFKPALVCADTFRAGAFDQLKQAALKANVPFYGSYSLTDPSVIAMQGVEKLKRQGNDLIIVDTSGRHSQSSELIEEMKAVASAVKPDLTLFVMDASVGQAVKGQAKAFKENAELGGVIVTKLDGHAKGGGALTAVATTRAPINFVGSGERLEQFESFESKRFVSRLLGYGDLPGFADKISDAFKDDKELPDLMEKITKANFTPRLLREQYQQVNKVGPMGDLMNMLPGFQGMGEGQEEASQSKMKKMLVMLDSMTEKELDTEDARVLSMPSRMERIARGSGRSLSDAYELVEEFNRLKGMMGKMSNMKMPRKGGNLSAQAQSKNAAELCKAMPPGVLEQIGGQKGLQSMLKQLEGKDPSQLMSQLQGGNKS